MSSVKFAEIADNALTAELAKYEKQEIWTKYKFGLLYVKGDIFLTFWHLLFIEGQTDEDEIFGNSKTPKLRCINPL